MVLSRKTVKFDSYTQESHYEADNISAKISLCFIAIILDLSINNQFVRRKTAHFMELSTLYHASLREVTP